MSHRYFIVAGFFLLLLSACGPLPTEARKRFFWPPPPAEPKIEYVNYYASDDDLQRGVDTRLREAILGKRRPEPLFIQPFSVAIGTRNRIYVTDFSKAPLQILDLEGHKLRELMVQTGGKLQKVVSDTHGEIWVLDAIKSAIEHFDENEQSLQVVTLEGVSRAASFAVDRERDRLYVLDTPAHLIRIYTLSGDVVGQIGRRGENSGEFNFPTDLDVDGDGTLFVLDTMNARIQVLQPDGKLIRSFGERGSARGSFGRPKALALDHNGHVFVTDAVYSKIVIFSTDGEYLLSFGGYEQIDRAKGIVPGGLDFPAGIAANAAGDLWVADLFNSLVHHYQLLTPEYLRQHPVNPADLYLPTTLDLSPAAEAADVSPVTDAPVTPHPAQ